jgi:hypothetical protein
MPRVSAFSGAAMGFQSFAAGAGAMRKMSGGGACPRNSLGVGSTALTEKDIDERVCVYLRPVLFL